jgi:hypothetical protein
MDTANNIAISDIRCVNGLDRIGSRFRLTPTSLPVLHLYFLPANFITQHLSDEDRQKPIRVLAEVSQAPIRAAIVF